MGKQDARPQAPEHRQAGMMVSVRVERLLAILRAAGAADIEHARGNWNEDDWGDFNPLAAPQLAGGTTN
jgi:hypothetical protein